MMADWRKQFGAGLPFMIVQIPDYGPMPTAPTESLWSDVREAQRRAAEADAHAALVVTIDIGDPKLLHPTNKQEVGRRLVHRRAASAVWRGDRAVGRAGGGGEKERRCGDGVVPRRDRRARPPITASPMPLNCAMPPAAAGRAPRWQAIMSRLSDAGNATRVRYCWGDSPVCTLSDGSALPAGPFEVPIQ